MGLEAVLPRSGLSGGGDKTREAPGRPAQVAACGQRRIWWVFHPCREPESTWERQDRLPSLTDGDASDSLGSASVCRAPWPWAP